MGYLDQGMAGAQSSLDAAKAVYDPLAQKYGAGTDLYLDALGVNGAEGLARAQAAYTPSPGLEYATNAALNANDRLMASRGMLASGNNLNMTGNIAGKLAYDDYNNWRNSLAGLGNFELGVASGLAGIETGRAGLHQSDATNRVGLAGNVVTGMNNATTQAANAEMQGSANLWNLGLNLAKLGTGFLGGSAGR
jgi:hypothetical protein